MIVREEQNLLKDLGNEQKDISITTMTIVFVYYVEIHRVQIRWARHSTFGPRQGIFQCQSRVPPKSRAIIISVLNATAANAFLELKRSSDLEKFAKTVCLFSIRKASHGTSEGCHETADNLHYPSFGSKVRSIKYNIQRVSQRSKENKLLL
jgi:hypothetical protein